MRIGLIVLAVLSASPAAAEVCDKINLLPIGSGAVRVHASVTAAHLLSLSGLATLACVLVSLFRPSPTTRGMAGALALSSAGIALAGWVWRGEVLDLAVTEGCWGPPVLPIAIFAVIAVWAFSTLTPASKE